MWIGELIALMKDQPKAVNVHMYSEGMTEFKRVSSVKELEKPEKPEKQVFKSRKHEPMDTSNGPAVFQDPLGGNRAKM